MEMHRDAATVNVLYNNCIGPQKSRHYMYNKSSCFSAYLWIHKSILCVIAFSMHSAAVAIRVQS